MIISFGARPLIQFLLALLFLMAGLLPLHAGAKPDILKLKPQEIKLSARPVPFRRGKPGQKIFGKLVFRGGFVLRSSSDYWGGLSGIALSRDGQKGVLVSDAGFWAQLKLSYANNRLVAPKAARVGPLQALKGRPLKRQRDRDAEAITLVDDKRFLGQCYISFEDNHRVGRFRLTPDGVTGPQSYLPLRSVTGQLRGNAGLESLSVLRGGRLKGALAAISQSRKDRSGNFIGWLYHKSRLRKIRFTPPPLDMYRITDAVSTANGDLILLERRYKFLKVNIRVRYVPQRALLSGKPISGHILMEADSHRHMVDNMEGIAVHRNKAGETILTLVSDDNFNGFQKTLLLQFMLPDATQLALSKG